jgi:hypothetical protein
LDAVTERSGADLILTALLTAPVVCEALIDVITARLIGVERVARATEAIERALCVLAGLGAAAVICEAFIDVITDPSVLA